jgi:hypothetical protein
MPNPIQPPGDGAFPLTRSAEGYMGKKHETKLLDMSTKLEEIQFHHQLAMF